MENLVISILEIEKKAGAILGEALKIKSRLPDSIKEDTQKLKDEYTKRAQKRIDTIRQSEDEYLRQEKSRILEEKQNKIDVINQKFGQNLNKWVDKLCKNILEQ